MIQVSEKFTTAPAEFKTPLQEMVYKKLSELEIKYERVDTSEVITMEDCIAINEKLDMNMVKTLFLSNRQQTAFYLFVTRGDKAFQSKAFSDAMNIARVSFAPLEKMEELLGTKIGAATIFSALLDSAKDVQIVLDQDVVDDEWYGCSDGTTTGYMKIATKDILEKFIPSTSHRVQIIRQ